HNFLFRLFLWLVSIILFTAAFALMTPFAFFTNWPLPIGLGGVWGDKILNVISLYLFSFSTPIESMLWGIALAFASFIMAIFSGNVVWRRQTDTGESEPVRVDPIFETLENEEYSNNEVHSGFFSTAFGAVLHFLYFLQARFERFFSFMRWFKKTENSFDRIEPVFFNEKTEFQDFQNTAVFASDNSVLKASKARSKYRFTLPRLDYLSIPSSVVKNMRLSPVTLK
ncbi:MAG: cell division protein FtsK, partial [Bartonella sp.]|nr:cell division protein FtsK [Bartonella sp.]